MKQLAVSTSVAMLLWSSCPAKAPDPGSPGALSKRPEPLTAVGLAPSRGEGSVGDGGDDVEAVFRVAPLAPVGPPVPPTATVVHLDGERATVGGRPFVAKAGAAPVVLSPTAETYLAQVAELLAALDDAGVEVMLAHPDAPLAFRVVLRDEASFQAWLEEPIPGKVRLIHRQDGFELTTNLGKLPGGDPNGPTVPLRGGQLDLPRLQRGLTRVRQRFPEATDLCVLPAFGIELAQVARALAADFVASDTAVFPVLCLVYPRPMADAGK